jgi:hypothetical protein
MFDIDLERDDLDALPPVCVATGTKRDVTTVRWRFPIKASLSAVNVITMLLGYVTTEYTFLDVAVPIGRGALLTLRLQRALAALCAVAICAIGTPVCISIRDPRWMMATVALFLAPAVVCLLGALTLLKDRLVKLRLERDGQLVLSVRSGAAAKAIRKGLARV